MGEIIENLEAISKALEQEPCVTMKNYSHEEIKHFAEEWTKGIHDDVPTADVIEIPKGATNGDVIKAMFPNAEFLINEFLGEKGTVFFESDDNVIIYQLDWWNAPYRKE